MARKAPKKKAAKKKAVKKAVKGAMKKAATKPAARRPRVTRQPGFDALVSELASLRRAVERLTATLGAARGIDARLDDATITAGRRAAARAAGPSVADRFPFGVWQSNDAAQRWRLDFNDNGCEWTERAPSGATLVRRVELHRVGTSWRIQRPNDREVLRFLGASPGVADAIVAANPQPSFIDLDILADQIAGEWNGVRWTLDAQGNLGSIEQPGSNPSTIKQYALVRQGDDAQWFTVAKGQLTFDQEGHEGTIFHSRWLHWPGGASGVTLGRGYDMGQRTAASVRAELVAAGVAQAAAAVFAGGAGLTGAAASDFVSQKRKVCGNLTPGQQQRLFAAVYQELEDDTKRICNKADVVQKFGAVDFATLDARIWTVVVDLRFRGDYTPQARNVIQKAVVRNDLAAFRTAIADRSKWPNVPPVRFGARVAALG
ncbi:MAG TPA: pesticin C-terminus-like muramidase [Luteitalea sp.]|nr:pesticin C-terminus-like muramidase [Luteitalea sp.]